MTIDPTVLAIYVAIITASSTLLGILITNYFNLRTTRLTKESEERKHQKEIVIKAAIENWKQVADLMMKGGTLGQMSPLDVFIVHMSAFSGVIFDPTTNTDNLKDRLDEVDRLTAIVKSTIKDPERLTPRA